MTLRIERLSVTFHNDSHAVQALEEVSLTLEPGRCVALVGESGSGKTTLGKACMGLLPENARQTGKIWVQDLLLQGLDQLELERIRWERIAMVFQGGASNLNPVYRVVDQVAEPLVQRRGLGRSEAREQAGHSLVSLGLSEDLFGRYPHELSGGEAQRVLLAMATILDPEALVLDEPTASLDSITKLFVSEKIGRLKRSGKAILLITHDLELAAGMADAGAVLYLGQIMETMPGRELLASPLHPYTVSLTRSFPTMATARDLGGIRGDAFYRFLHRHPQEDRHEHDHLHVQAPHMAHDSVHAPPTGCLFRDRCTQSKGPCSIERPQLEGVGSHRVRCLRGGVVDLLTLRGVSKRYGKTVALEPVDLTLKAGEVFTLVGETGSGKTTLAMIAAGVLKPDSGQIDFDGQDMYAWGRRDYKSLSRKIGVIYQSPAEAVSPRFTVYEAVAEPLRIHGEDKDEHLARQRVLKALADVHLSTDPDFLKRYPHELNAGAIQRITMARALILSPSLVIADEPTSFLDPSVQAKVMKLLLDLQIEMGLTLLFVTHDLALARKIGDRMGVLLSGQMVESGPANVILSSPSHPYTRELIDHVGGFVAESTTITGPKLTQGDTGGCSFASRCATAMEICHNQAPCLRKHGLGQVACHYPLDNKPPGLHPA
jgi:peptide/nickel transport system ATP-binding protein